VLVFVAFTGAPDPVQTYETASPAMPGKSVDAPLRVQLALKSAVAVLPSVTEVGFADNEQENSGSGGAVTAINTSAAGESAGAMLGVE
jgi:hypothetical protein